MAWAFAWPIAWIAYTFIRGAVVHWYPYPFLDVDDAGYRAAFGRTLFILALAVVLVLIFKRIDRLRTIGAPPQQPLAPPPERSPTRAN